MGDAKKKNDEGARPVRHIPHNITRRRKPSGGRSGPAGAVLSGTIVPSFVILAHRGRRLFSGTAGDARKESSRMPVLTALSVRRSISAALLAACTLVAGAAAHAAAPS